MLNYHIFTTLFYSKFATPKYLSYFCIAKAKNDFVYLIGHFCLRVTCLVFTVAKVVYFSVNSKFYLVKWCNFILFL